MKIKKKMLSVLTSLDFASTSAPAWISTLIICSLLFLVANMSGVIPYCKWGKIQHIYGYAVATVPVMDTIGRTSIKVRGLLFLTSEFGGLSVALFSQ